MQVMNGKGTGSVSDFLDGLEWVYDNFTAQVDIHVGTVRKSIST